MTLMLHAGAKPIDYDGLRTLHAPTATQTHVPIPHHRVVDLAAYSLSYFGHEVVERHFGCQTASKVDPGSASNFDPLGVARCGERPTGWSWSGLRSPVGRVV